MTVTELKELLEEYPDELEVRIALQPNYPLESNVAGVVALADLEDEDDEPVDPDDDCLYILEGSQIGYARSGLWSQA